MATLKNHEKIVKQSRDMYGKLSDIISDFIHDDKEKVEYLTKVKSLLEVSIKNEMMINDVKKAVLPFKDQFNNNEDEDGTNIDKVKKEYDDIIEGYKDERKLKKVFKSHMEIQNLLKTIQDIKGNSEAASRVTNKEEQDEDEEELTATQDAICLIDPISKKLMTDPVRHTLCGHVYERESTLQMIKQRKRKGFRCPYMGCAYRLPINAQDLDDALDYKQEIIRRKRAGTYEQ